MTYEGKPFGADHVFKRVIWRHIVSLTHTMEQAVTWSITGIAAIMGLFISNIDSVGTLVSSTGLRWFLLTLTASLAFGAMSKQVGMVLGKGLEVAEKVEALLYSEQGQALMSQMSTPPTELMYDIAEPFFWPLSAYMRKSGLQGIQDYLSADKRFVKLFCIQLIFVYLHGICAAAGLLIIAFCIN